MNEDKTLIDWLSQLPEPYASQAFDNFMNHYGRLADAAAEMPCASIEDALLQAFQWGDSPQGHNYWSDLLSTLKTNQPQTAHITC